MTQPVQEPSQGRVNQGDAFRTRQLYRRPASPGSPLSAIVIAAYVLLDQTNPQSITSSSSYTQAISFDTEELDTNDIWDVGDPTKFTIPFDGIYLAQATAGFVTDGTGDRAASLFKNKGLGSEEQLVAVQGPAGASFFWGGFCGVTDSFLAGDYIELYVAQNRGSSLDTGDCWMSVFAVGATP